jgi:hypothetical protein
MTKEYIDRNGLIEALNKFAPEHYNALINQLITKYPTADVVEVKHGEWILTKTEIGWNCTEYPAEYTCSVCGRKEKQEEPYCHCGAKMDGGK